MIRNVIQQSMPSISATTVNTPRPVSIRMHAWKLAFCLLLMTVTVSSVAQDFVSQNASRELLQLPLDERRVRVAVTDLEFSPDGKYIATGASDGVVRLLRTSKGSSPQVVLNGDNSVTKKFSFSPDSKLLGLQGSSQAEIVVLGANHERPTLGKQRVLAASTCVTFSPDGKRLAIGYRRDRGRVVDLKTGASHLEMAPFAGAGRVDTGLYDPTTIGMDFSPDGKLLAVTTDFWDDELVSFENVQVWNVMTGKLRCSFRGQCCGFSPAGDLLAYQSYTYDGDGGIVLLDIDTDQPVGGLTGEYRDARFAPDGRSIAAIGNQQVELWTIAPRDDQPREYTRVRVLKHATRVTCVAFAPDGLSLVTGDSNGAIRSWQLKNGSEQDAFR